MQLETNDLDLWEYYQKVCNHDWYYVYSDDHKAYRKGHEEWLAIREEANTDGGHKDELLSAYAEYLNGKANKPEITYNG